MPWSRHHADDIPLGELMEEQPDEAGPTAAAGSTADDDTAVRASLADPETGSAAHEPESTDSFLDDEDYLPQERRGPGRLTIALVAALVLAVGVLGGVWVQKSLGTSAAAAGFAARQGAGAGSGTGGTGTRGYGGAGAGSESGTTGGTGGRAIAPTTTAAPVVVGTVASAGKRSLVVTDLGGTRHTVALTATTTVTTAYAHGVLKTGDTVAVVGSTATDGSVTATGITVT